MKFQNHSPDLKNRTSPNVDSALLTEEMFDKKLSGGNYRACVSLCEARGEATSEALHSIAQATWKMFTCESKSIRPNAKLERGVRWLLDSSSLHRWIQGPMDVKPLKFPQLHIV